VGSSPIPASTSVIRPKLFTGNGLWRAAKGDWKRAHESAPQDEGPEGSWVHTYLRRKEGDQGNAAYWYGLAGKPVCREPLDAEWVSIVRALLG
jgi:hypothetical protein